MPQNTALEMLKCIRSRKGCTFRDLERSLPESYLFTDASPWYFLRDPLRRLFEWGLVQAYENNRTLIDPTASKEFDWYKLRDCTFYVSPLAAALEAELGFFLVGGGSSLFGEPLPRDTMSWPEVFVLMPFSQELKPIYEDHIKPTVEKVGFSVARADNFFGTRSVIAEIWTAINYADLVIADCTGRNPNVFYEIGIAHTLGKETILISQSIDDVPFDLRHLRIIIYEFKPRGTSQLERDLVQTLGAKSLADTPASKRASTKPDRSRSEKAVKKTEKKKA